MHENEPLQLRFQSHPTVGVALFGSSVSERCSSLRGELPVDIIILLVYRYDFSYSA